MPFKLVGTDIRSPSRFGLDYGGGMVGACAGGGGGRTKAVIQNLEGRGKGIYHGAVATPGTADFLHAVKPGLQGFTHG